MKVTTRGGEGEEGRMVEVAGDGVVQLDGKIGELHVG